MVRTKLRDKVAAYRANYKKRLVKIAGLKTRHEYRKLSKSQQENIEKKYKEEFPNELIQPENANDTKKLEEILSQTTSKSKSVKQESNNTSENNIIDSMIKNSGKSNFFIIQISKHGSNEFNKNIYHHGDWQERKIDHPHGKINPGDYLLFYFTLKAKIKEGYKKTLKVFCRVISTSPNKNTIKFERLGELKGISYESVKALQKILEERSINYSFKNLAREGFNVVDITKHEIQLLSDIDKNFKNVFLCSIQSKEAFEHFNDTVLTPQNLATLKVKNEMKQFPQMCIWGAKYTPQYKTHWDQIQKGDLILFYRNDYYVNSGVFEDKEDNKELAEKLWGKDSKDNRTWQLIMYILPETLKSSNVQKEKLNDLLKYSQNAYPRNNNPFYKIGVDKTLEMMLYGS